MFKFLCIPVSDSSGPLLSPPPRFTRVLCPPGHLSRLLSPFFLFASSPSISVYSAAPLQQRLVYHRLSVGSLQPSGWRPTNVLSWFPVQRPICRFAPPLTCASRGTRLGCGRRGEGYGAPHDGLESLNASAGDARVACRLRCSSSLFDSCGARLSVWLPPPPSPFPCTTLLVPILSLLTEEYFRDCSVRPYPAGPGRPGGCFKRLWSLSLSSPHPPYIMAISSGSHSPLKGNLLCFWTSVGETAPRARTTGQVTALARRGTGTQILWNNT